MSNTVIIQAADPGSTVFRQLVWRKVKIRKSLDEICHYMELTLPISEREKIHKHDKVEIRCSNPLFASSNPKPRVTTIMVDEVSSFIDFSQKSLSVIGRSPARDIIDSKWSDMHRNSKSLETIVNEIVTPFFDAIGIQRETGNRPYATRMPTDGPEPGPLFNFTYGNESPWTKLINAADNLDYILTSNEAGGLYIWKVGGSRRDEGFFIEEGKNIREIQYIQNGAEQYHEYKVKAGYREAVVIDNDCKNNRKLWIDLADSGLGEEGLRRRANTEMRSRKQNQIIVTVSGWGLNNQQIAALGNTHGKEVFWNPNFLIPVRIPSLGFNDSLLLLQVEYIAEPTTMTSTLTLVNPERIRE